MDQSSVLLTMILLLNTQADSARYHQATSDQVVIVYLTISIRMLFSQQDPQSGL